MSEGSFCDPDSGILNAIHMKRLQGRSNNSVKAPGGSEQDQAASAGPSAVDPADAAAGVGVAGSADSAGSATTIAGNLNSKFNVFQDIVAETPGTYHMSIAGLR